MSYQRNTNKAPTGHQRDTNGDAQISNVNNVKNDKECKEVIQYLNLKIGKKYRESTQSIIRLISARINEGNGVQDFKDVIDEKCRQWLVDEKMKIYLRPETLFGTKFETYRNEVSKKIIKTELSCPDGFDSFTWNQMSEQDKQKYLVKA